MTVLGGVILGVLLLGSAAVWVVIVLRFRRGDEVVPRRERIASPLNPLAKLLGIVMVVYMLGNQVLLLSSPPPQEPRALTLEMVQGVCQRNLLIALILLGAVTDFGTVKLSGTSEVAGSWRDEVTFGALGCLAGLLPVFAVQFLLIGLGLREEENQHTFFQILQEHPGATTLLWIALAAVVLAPLAEELIFRVIFQQTLSEVYVPAVAITVTAVSFACVHGWPDLLPLLPLALILGYVMHQRGSFLAVLVLHLLFNAVNLTLYLASPNSL